MSEKEYEDWQLIHWLKDFAEEINMTPRIIDMDVEPSMPSSSTYQERFGTWNKALKKAGLKINHPGKYSKKEVIEKLIKKKKEIGRLPTTSEMKKFGDIPNRSVYRKKFGTWEKALKKAGLAKKEKNNYSDEIIIEKLYKFAKKLGRTPTFREVNKNKDLPSASTYCRHFGKFSKACEKAGLVPFKEPKTWLERKEFNKRKV